MHFGNNIEKYLADPEYAKQQGIIIKKKDTTVNFTNFI